MSLLWPLEPVVVCYCNPDIGDVYMWGWNESGQLGLPSKNISEQTKDRSRSCQCDKEERVPMATGKTEVVNILPLPHLVDIVTQTSQSHEEREVNVVSVSCGSRHTVVLSGKLSFLLSPILERFCRCKVFLKRYRSLVKAETYPFVCV